MVNMMKLMKQAASMKTNMEKMQAEMAQRPFEFSSGGGMVTAEVKGDMSLTRVRIDPKAVDPSDVEMLQDLVVSAVNGAMQAARDAVATEMNRITGGLGGMGIPGL